MGQIIDEVSPRIASRFGLQAAAVSFAMSTALSVGVAVHQRITRFDKGYETAIEDLREGALELDGEVVKIMTSAEEEALEALAAGTKAGEEFTSSQDKHIASLMRLLGQHAANRQDKDRNYAPSTNWGTSPLPPHASLRLDNITRERRDDSNIGADGTTNDFPGLVGDSPSNPPPL